MLTPDHTRRSPGTTTRDGPQSDFESARGLVRFDTRLGSRLNVLLGVLLCACLAMPVALATQPGPPLEPQDAIGAFQRVESWVRSGEVIGDVGAIDVLGDSFAACVTLRAPDRLLGEGVAHAEESGGATDGLLARATRRAIEQAREQAPELADPGSAAWDRVRVGLELASRPIPLDAMQIAEASLLVSPGTEGVAARLGDRWSIAFPASMLTRSREPGPVLASLVVELSGNGAHALTPLPELRDLGFDLYRFGTLHLAQTRPGSAPIFLFRGGRVVASSGLGRAGLERFAHELASNLAERRWPGIEPYGMTGTYDAGRGEFEEPVADPRQQAVAALAMIRAALTLDRPALRAAGVDVLADLGDVDVSEPAPWTDPPTAALAVIASTELGDLDALLPDNADGAARRASVRALDEACRVAVEASAERASSNAAVALALHRMGDKRGAEGLSAILRETPPQSLAGQMPWLAWLAIELAGAPDNAADPAPMPGDIPLRRMREIVWEHQVRGGDLDETTRDLSGGIVFTDSSNPLPTWQAARPLAGIAAMLGDPRLTQRTGSDETGLSEYHAELSRLIASLRFMQQLAGQEAHSAIHARPGRGRWGIRLAPWDQRMPPGATAITLLAVLDTLESIDAVEAASADGGVAD